jgi:glycosidase
MLTILTCQRKEERNTLSRSQLAPNPREPWIQEAHYVRIELVPTPTSDTFQKLFPKIALLQQMGFTVVWFSSLFPSSSLNLHPSPSDPFPTHDYRTVNDGLGTLDEFQHLVDEIHRQGMRAVIDLQAGFTAWDSKLVLEHPDWFLTNQEGAIVSPTPELSDVAALNYRHHELRKYMIETMKFWVRDIGVDGFACLTADLVPLDFWKRARYEVEKIKPILLIGERHAGESPADVFDATYSPARGGSDAGAPEIERLLHMVESESEQFPSGVHRLQLSRTISSYPQTRTRRGNEGLLDMVRTTLVYTVPGNPVWVLFDEELFGESETQRKEMKLLTALSNVRRKFAPFQRGEFKKLQLSDTHEFIAFERRRDREQILVLLNVSAHPRRIALQLPAPFSGTVVDYFLSKEIPVRKGTVQLHCNPFEAKILIRSSQGNPS